MEEFEVHLLSTASMNIFADDTLASFKNQLPQNLSLEGDWRVALSEIIFPSNINNVYTDFFLSRPQSKHQKCFWRGRRGGGRGKTRRGSR